MFKDKRASPRSLMRMDARTGSTKLRLRCFRGHEPRQRNPPTKDEHGKTALDQVCDGRYANKKNKDDIIKLLQEKSQQQNNS